MIDAILGTSVTIDSLDGAVDLDVRAGVQSGDVLTIRERGITPLRGSVRGDLRVAVQVVTPAHLDPKSRALVQELAKRTKPGPPHLAEFHPGLFAKLRDKFKR